MENITPTPVVWEPNPYTVNLQQLGKWTFIFLMAGILIFLLLKIILDLRRLHYKN